jgi:hypothetical protein
MWHKLRMQILYHGLPINILYLSYPCLEVMKSVDSHMWQLVTAVVMKVMVWHFVSESHKVMTALIVMLPWNCYCGDFSAVHKISISIQLGHWHTFGLCEMLSFLLSMLNEEPLDGQKVLCILSCRQTRQRNFLSICLEGFGSTKWTLEMSKN